MKYIGAQNEAHSFFINLKLKVEKSNNLDSYNLIRQIHKQKPNITHPLIFNSINYLNHNLDKEDTRSHVLLKINNILNHFEQSQKQIAKQTASKIKDGFVIFTHSYSTTVLEILKYAKDQGTKFTVLNTETRPTLEGRKTSIELHKYGINNTIYVDSAARLALKRADLYLIGADAISKDKKIIGRVGSEMFAQVAQNLNVPLYCCIDSWKYNPNFQFSDKKQQIWDKSPVKVNNHSYEFIDPELITALVTELGILNPEVLQDEIKRRYPWLLLS